MSSCQEYPRYQGVVIAYAYFLMVIMFLPLLFPTIAEVPTAEAQFTVANWSYPDNDGQGIEGFSLYENSTGSWVQVGGYYSYGNTTAVEWTAGVAVKIYMDCWVNRTVIGQADGDTSTGPYYIRHNVTVTNRQGDTIFSKANFTYESYLGDAASGVLWNYRYYVVLNFLPAATQAYTATVTYEVWY